MFKALIIIVIAVVVLRYLTLPAVAVLSLLPQIEPPPINYLTGEPSQTMITLEESQIALDIYNPKQNPRAVLVMFHAANELGRDDPRLQRIANAFSRTGLVVYTPTLPSISREVFHPQVIDEMTTVIEFAQRQNPKTPLKIFSFSIGVGPELIAASQLEKQANLVIAMGGYLDPEEVVAFHTTGESPDPFGRQLFEQYYAQFTPEELERFLQELDPKSHLPDLESPILLLHSRTDPIIPFVESEKLFTELTKLNKEVKFIKLQLFNHVNLELPPFTIKNLATIYLPEFTRLYRAAFQIVY